GFILYLPDRVARLGGRLELAERADGGRAERGAGGLEEAEAARALGRDRHEDRDCPLVAAAGERRAGGGAQVVGLRPRVRDGRQRLEGGADPQPPEALDDRRAGRGLLLAG